MTSELQETHTSVAGYAVGITADAIGGHRTGIDRVDAARLQASRPLHRPMRQLAAPPKWPDEDPEMQTFNATIDWETIGEAALANTKRLTGHDTF